jgi:CopA family copper-resistance protein
MNLQSNLITRRNFLRFTTGMGMALALEQLIPHYAKAGIQASSEVLEEINLHIEETRLTIGDRSATALTVNGTVPGPLIRLREGQTATIKVTNHLKQDTSIHWHGIILPPNMDGVPGLSFRGIKPGETFTYQFPVNQSGTYWYHSHSGLQEQQGHYGALIVEPVEPDPFEYDRDYVVALSDWTFENPHAILANLKKMSAYYNYQRRTASTFFEDLPWRGMRMDPTDIADVTGATYTYLTNGLAPDSNWTGIFQPGDKVRLRFINASAMTFFDVRIPGLKMTVVQADGQNVQPVTVDEFRIGVAETYDVIVEPKEEEAYTIFAETMDRSGYARGTLAVRQGTSAPIPERRDRPVRTMADMGMNHGSHDMSGTDSHDTHQGHDMSGTSSSDAHQGHDMSGTSSSDIHQGHDMSGAGSHGGHQSRDLLPAFNPGEVMHGPDNHGLGNAGVPMMVKSRLHEPGIGLENTGTRVLVYTDLRGLSPGLVKERRKEN